MYYTYIIYMKMFRMGRNDKHQGLGSCRMRISWLVRSSGSLTRDEKLFPTFLFYRISSCWYVLKLTNIILAVTS